MGLMRKKPFSFDLHKYIVRKGWNELVTGTRTAWIREFNSNQEVYCSLLLQRRSRPKRLLDPKRYSELISQWAGYGTIIAYINAVLTHPNTDESNMWPQKRRHLFLVGAPDIGKTTLVNALREFLPVYPFGAADKWWPRYAIYTYSLIEWGEFTLSTTAMPFGDLLKLLGGEQMNLPVKGSNVFKMDRQAFIMSSNLTLVEHLRTRFTRPNDETRFEPALRARIDELIIPDGLTLFPLIDLLIQELRN